MPLAVGSFQCVRGLLAPHLFDRSGAGRVRLSPREPSEMECIEYKGAPRGMKSGASAFSRPRLNLPSSFLPSAFPIRTHSLTHTMSGITEVNQIAAASAGADAATTIIIADAFGLMHVLQVYTSAMVRLIFVLRRRLLIKFVPRRWRSPFGTGSVACPVSQHQIHSPALVADFATLSGAQAHLEGALVGRKVSLHLDSILRYVLSR
jgi:hypothetical protein